MRGSTIHGGRLSEARRVFGDSAEPWLDLSTGINPHGWPGASTVAIDWRALPDEDALVELEQAAAAYFGANPAHVCALPGTEIGLRLLDRLAPSGACHVVPSYRTHREAIADSRAIDAADIAAAAASGALILLANPNNPDGRIIAPGDLLGVAQTMARGGLLVVDEAFADACPEASLVVRVGDDLPLLVFRSFGKFFGLAGLRLGFAIGPKPIVATLRQALGNWPVSSAALAIGIAAYRDADWIAGMRRQLALDAAALDTVLRRHGFEPIGACPLFRLIACDDARGLFDRLARRSILTRPFDDDPRWLRIGLPGDAAALDRLDRALADV